MTNYRFRIGPLTSRTQKATSYYRKTTLLNTNLNNPILTQYAYCNVKFTTFNNRFRFISKGQVLLLADILAI